MGFLADIICGAAGMLSQAVELELKSLCKIIQGLCHRMVWMIFAVFLMLLGAVFAVWGICALLEPLVGLSLAAVIVGAIVILVGLVIICAANSCRSK